MPKTTEECDHVDRFLEQIKQELPNLDLEVEGMVERLGGLSRRFHRSADETVAEFGLTSGEWKVLSYLRQAGKPYRRSAGQLAERAELSSGAREDSVTAQASKEGHVAAALNAREKRELNALLRRLMLEFERREQG